jgi:iron-sulfur cluster assembly protein
MITVTPQAAERIKAATLESGAQDMGLRLAARPLEDGSLDYGMGFDYERENDQLVETHGLTVFISPASRDYLEGVTLDYVELEPGDFRFIFIPADAPKEEAGSCASGAGEKKSGGGCGGGCSCA